MKKNMSPKHHSQLSRGHYNKIYDSQLQNTKVLRTQPQQQGTLTQPLHCDLPRLSCKAQKNYAHRLHKVQLQNEESRRPSGKTTILKHFQKEFYIKRKIISAKMKKLLPKHHLQLSCSHYNKIYDSQLQNTKVLRTQPQQQGTLTQPLHCDLPRLSCKAQKNYAHRLHKVQLQNEESRRPSGKTTILKHFQKEFYIKRKIISAKIKKKMLPKHHSQLSCNHYSTIYDTDLQTTIRITRLYWRTSTIRAALAQPFPYDLHRLNGTTQFATHYCRTHRLDALVPMDKVSQQKSLCGKNTMFRANPNIQIASMM